MKTKSEKEKMIGSPENKRQFLRNQKQRHDFLTVKRHTSTDSMRAI